jgi:hypothetical protein
MPAAATQNTEEGLKAFTQYWFDTVSYALESGDTALLKAASTPDCKICNGFADEALSSNSGGKWTISTKWTITSFRSDLNKNPLGQSVGYFTLTESASTDFNSDGSVIASRSADRADKPRVAYAVFQGGAWVMAQSGNA